MRLRPGIGFCVALLLSGGAAAEGPAAAHTKQAGVAARAPVAAGLKSAAPAGADKHYGTLKIVGARQLGKAAWYGGRYVGRKTSGGERLDRVHATAAHRSLPLNSLARVTNLNNGRSVVVRVTDRGPVSTRLLIDVSPSAADALDMKSAGLVPVAVEQVVELPPDAK
jgi:rare lipoprotein A